MHEDVWAFAPTQQEQPVQLQLCGVSFCDGSYRIKRENEPLYVFEYVMRGTGTVTVDGKTYTASAGQVYIVPECSRHEYYSDSRDPWVKIFFNVSGPLVRQLVKLYGLVGRVVYPGGELLPLFLQFVRLAGQSPVHDEIIGPCTLKLHEIVQALGATVQETPSVSEEALRLKSLLDSRVSGDISTEEMAAALFRSKDYVIKLFRREFGETPHAYFLRQKMALAGSLLAGTKLSVKQVAAALGYEDQHYFSNVFKKATGLSPLAYRRTV